MEKTTVKAFYGVFRSPTAVLATVLLTAIICAGASQVKGRAGSTANDSADNAEVSREQSDEWQTVRMRVTAYCPCKKCCGKYSDGVTACGHKICAGDAFVAADKKYRFGTKMRVPGYNNERAVKVLDRGGVIRGNRLDVFFHSHREAVKWGVKYLYVKVHQDSGGR